MSSFGGLLIWLIVVAAGSYWISRRRITSLASAQSTKPHSLALYYGFYAAIWAFVPALLLLIIITAFTKPFLEQQILQSLLAAQPDLPASFIDLKIA